jgi:hypothetical protein
VNLRVGDNLRFVSNRGLVKQNEGFSVI